MSKEALVEAAIVDGLDERAAEAMVHQNDGIHNRSDVIKLAEQAEEQSIKAA